jgi:hypothetical protein
MYFDRKSLIVYKKPRKMDEKAFSEFLNQAAQDILARYGMSKIVVGLSEWNELRIFEPDQLEQLGLVRKEDVFLMRRDVDLSQYTEEEIVSVLTAYVHGPDEEE